MTKERDHRRKKSTLVPEKLGFSASENSLQKELKGQNYTFTPLREMNELAEAVELQQKVWRLSDYNTCPPHMLVTAIDSGGHVMGSRNDAGELVAFVTCFGAYDSSEKHPFILSDMAAVREDLRDANIGFSLKLAQAMYVAEQGISEIRWAYDPLRSRNAYLNLHKLGAVATEFHTDKYGNSLEGSQNVNVTDSFMVRWFIDDARTQQRIINGPPPISLTNIPVASLKRSTKAEEVAIEIPTNIESLSIVERAKTQLTFRELASKYIGKLGYHAVDYVVSPDNRGFYILENTKKS